MNDVSDLLQFNGVPRSFPCTIKHKLNAIFIIAALWIGNQEAPRQHQMLHSAKALSCLRVLAACHCRSYLCVRIGFIHRLKSSIRSENKYQLNTIYFFYLDSPNKFYKLRSGGGESAKGSQIFKLTLADSSSMYRALILQSPVVLTPAAAEQRYPWSRLKVFFRITVDRGGKNRIKWS